MTEEEVWLLEGIIETDVTPPDTLEIIHNPVNEASLALPGVGTQVAAGE
jgi:hypothetical protein